MCFFLLKEGVYRSSGKIIHLFYQYLLGDVLGWIAGKKSLRFMCRRSAGEHSQDQHLLWGLTGVGTGQRQKWSCASVTIEVWTDSWWALELEWPCRGVLSLSRAFAVLGWPEQWCDLEWWSYSQQPVLWKLGEGEPWFWRGVLTLGSGSCPSHVL